MVQVRAEPGEALFSISRCVNCCRVDVVHMHCNRSATVPTYCTLSTVSVVRHLGYNCREHAPYRLHQRRYTAAPTCHMCQYRVHTGVPRQGSGTSVSRKVQGRAFFTRRRAWPVAHSAWRPAHIQYADVALRNVAAGQFHMGWARKCHILCTFHSLHVYRADNVEFRTGATAAPRNRNVT